MPSAEARNFHDQDLQRGSKTLTQSDHGAWDSLANFQELLF
jgi:hypothetical protein